jgi:hypothetical protein
MKKYFDIWPIDDQTIQKVCQMTGIKFKEVKGEIVDKYRNGEMKRPGDGLFYWRNLLNQALREQGINIRVS